MCKLPRAFVARQCDNLMCWPIVCEFELDAVVSNQYIVKVLVLSCITFEQKIHSSDVLTLVMLNKCPTLHLNFFPVNCNIPVVSMYFQIRAENNVDPDQMALSEAS